MTDMSTTTSSRRVRAKRQALQRLDVGQSGLLLIAAVLLPLILYIALLYITSMLYDIIPHGWLSLLDVLAVVLSVPLIGGVLDIVQGLRRGEQRCASDLFQAYTSPRAWGRAWLAIALPLCIPLLTAGISVIILDLSHAMCNMVAGSEKWSIYIDLFLTAGDIFITLTWVGGLLLSGWLFCVPWLMYDTPHVSLAQALRRSVRAAHGHLGEILCFHLSFLGWLLLSVCTLGILLFLFVLPYYLLSSAAYASLLCRDIDDPHRGS